MITSLYTPLVSLSPPSSRQPCGTTTNLGFRFSSPQFFSFCHASNYLDDSQSSSVFLSIAQHLFGVWAWPSSRLLTSKAQYLSLSAKPRTSCGVCPGRLIANTDVALFSVGEMFHISSFMTDNLLVHRECYSSLLLRYACRMGTADIFVPSASR